MARSQNQPLELNNFSGGLITENSPLNFQPNTTLEETNFVLNRDGSRQRRLGIDFERDYEVTTSSIASTPEYTSSYLWRGAGEVVGRDIVVVQFGNYVKFFDARFAAISSNWYPVIVSNLPYSELEVTFSEPAEERRLEFATVSGKLVIANIGPVLWSVEYDPDAYGGDALLAQPLTDQVRVRDYWGSGTLLQEGVRPDGLPTTLPVDHAYNLMNSGWKDIAPMEWFEGGFGAWPSTSDLYHIGLKADGTWAASQYTDVGNVTLTPPYGRFILELFGDRGQQRQAAVDAVYPWPWGTMAGDSSSGRINNITTYAGRLWMTVRSSETIGVGENSPNFNSLVLFSQVINSEADWTKCYAKNDPASEDFNEPLDTDGGYVLIPEAEEIHDIKPLGNAVLAFAANGVWEITGSEGSFSPTSLSVNKVSSLGVSASNSVTLVEDTLFYVSPAGIIQLALDPVSRRAQPSNVTQSTVQGVLDGLALPNLREIKGTYDPVKREVRWLYSEREDGQYTNELVLNLNLGAFAKVSFGRLLANTPVVLDYIQPPTDVEVFNVKYLVLTAEGGVTYTIAAVQDVTFSDWVSADAVGVDAGAFMLSGYFTGGTTMLDKQATYLICNFEATEDGVTAVTDGFEFTNPSSCLVQAQWEWSTSADTGRWGREFQAYKRPRLNFIGDVDDYVKGFGVVQTKNKLRGKGKALSLKFTAEAGKEMKLLGWGLNIGSTSSV